MSAKKDIDFEEKILDRELVLKAKSGDAEAFRELVLMYERRLVNLAYSKSRNTEDAKDIVQDSFLKAWKNIAKFKGDSSFYTWIYRIVSNMTIDYSRKRYRQRERAVGESEVLDLTLQQSPDSHRMPMGHVAGPMQQLENAELAGNLKLAIEDLSPEHREVVVLREIEGLSYAEISEAVGCSRGTVMSRLHHARKKLQNFLRNISSDRSEKSFVGEKGKILRP